MMLGRPRGRLRGLGNGTATATGIPTAVTVTPNQLGTAPAYTTATGPGMITAAMGQGGFLPSLLKAGGAAYGASLQAKTAQTQAAANAAAQTQAATQKQSLMTVLLIGGGILAVMMLAKK